jgi:hypothetical protein
MPRFRLCLALVLASAALPAAASAAPPANDNYLGSSSLNQPGTAMPLEIPFSVDTTEATTQANMFDFDSQGQPFNGPPQAEPLSCGSTSVGKTVWYDFHPNVDGDFYVTVSSSGGTAFTPVLSLYEWTLQDSRLQLPVVRCAAATELVAPGVKKGKHYTLQLGGSGGAGGPLSGTIDFFPDRDDDGVYDNGPQKDECPTTPGTSNGCPPELRVSPSINYDRSGGGIRISSFVVNSVPKGATVKARGGGATQTVKAKKTGKVTLSKLVGRGASAGSSIELRVTLGRSGTGKYKYGATGAYFKWPVKAGGLGTRVARCLHAGSGKIERCR